MYLCIHTINSPLFIKSFYSFLKTDKIFPTKKPPNSHPPPFIFSINSSIKLICLDMAVKSTLKNVCQNRYDVKNDTTNNEQNDI